MAVSRLSQQSIQQSFPKGTTLWDGTTATSAFDSLGTVYVSSSGSVGIASFTNVPQTYTHLQLRLCVVESTADSYFLATYNSDTAQANYPRHRLWGNGASVGSNSTVNVDASTRSAMLGSPLYSTTHPGVVIADILDYANTSKNKTTMSFFGQDANGSGIVELHSSVWLNTAAITRVDVRCNLAGGGSGSSTFNAGSTISLYGVK